jgi:hypothetical protein
VNGSIKLGNTAVASSTSLDWYEEGTFTVTGTGLTTTVTGTAQFTRIGNLVSIDMPTISGTSNATTFTLTGIPTQLRPQKEKNMFMRISDNTGPYVLSFVYIGSNGIITLTKDAGSAAFTASGTKASSNFQITYQLG